MATIGGKALPSKRLSAKRVAAASARRPIALTPAARRFSDRHWPLDDARRGLDAGPRAHAPPRRGASAVASGAAASAGHGQNGHAGSPRPGPAATDAPRSPSSSPAGTGGTAPTGEVAGEAASVGGPVGGGPGSDDGSAAGQAPGAGGPPAADPPPLEPAAADFYRRIRGKLRRWAETRAGRASPWLEYLLAAPDLFHLMCRLMLDGEVRARDKAKLAAAIAYFVSPIDLVPEVLLGPIGYVDDLALAAFVLNGIIKENPEPVERLWAGEADVLTLVSQILDVADQMVGSGLWKQLRRLIP